MITPSRQILFAVQNLKRQMYVATQLYPFEPSKGQENKAEDDGTTSKFTAAGKNKYAAC